MRRVFLLAMALGLSRVVAAQGNPQRAFPHERHERLFPLCESCHAGVMTGDARTVMPTEASCRECHNGTDSRVVSWRRPARVEGLLRYSHPAHARQVDSAGKACGACHGASTPNRMPVQRAAPASCMRCHTHRATDHLADDNRCAVCHVPLVNAPSLTVERIAAFPRPPSHERPDFVSSHVPPEPAATCSTCHARESCARCHVNASSERRIVALGSDARVARLMRGKAPVYPVPADHRRDDFRVMHGEVAQTAVARCATCHARSSCATCHIGVGGRAVIERMPVPPRDGAQGVSLLLAPARRLLMLSAATPVDTPPAARIVRVHDPGFRTGHKGVASASAASCSGCHEQSFCSACHTGEGTRRFHAANFVQRHAADSYGQETRCASCHNTELFCRSCHRTSGLATQGRLDAAFHDAQPQWLLQHGRAARQGLQSCATCHAQRDCQTCHSTLGWGVNPHGPGFNAARAASRNATQCLLCHLQVPGRR